jgi:hypothetical protein
VQQRFSGSLTREHWCYVLLNSTKDHSVIEISVILVYFVKVLVEFFTSLGPADIGFLIVELCYQFVMFVKLCISLSIKYNVILIGKFNETTRD